MALATSPRENSAIKALRFSESRYRRLFETAQDGILLLNAETAQIEDVNPYLVSMLDYSHAEFLGKKIWEVGSFGDIAQSKAMFEELQANGYVRYKDLPLKTREGKEIAVEFVSNTYDCEGKQVIQCNIRNISERKADQALLQRHMHLYSALSQVNKAIVHCDNEEELYLHFCRTAVEFGGMKMAWVGLASSDGTRLLPITSFGEAIEDLIDVEIPLDVGIPFGRFPYVTSIREDQPYWCQDFMNDPNTAPWQARARRAGWAASASLPLHRNGIVTGVFILCADEAGAFDEPERKLLVEMAGDISFALDNFERELQRRQMQDDIEFKNTIFQMQQETSPDAILVVNDKAEIIFYNQRFIDLWRLSPQVLNTHVSAPVLRAVAEQVVDIEVFVARVKYLYAHRDEKSREEIQLKDGRTLDRYTSAITGANGKYYGRVWYLSDITERKQAADKIEHQAFYDALTNLPNRRLLCDRLQHSIAASERHRKYGAVLFLDLDHFKNINDSKGHDIGDLLLVEVAKRLQVCVREGDTVARLGGDEFIVILENLSEDQAQAAAQTNVISDKILAALGQPYLLAAHEYLCSASIGISLFLSREVAVDDLLKRADTAMYQAKTGGRNTRRFYDPALQATLEARTALEADLRCAQSKNQLCLYYQKQVDHTGHVLGAEVLVRWRHPELGLISPMQFIPLAEETGLILPIGQWVLETACARLKLWEADPLTRDLKLAVNVSAGQFHQPDFVGQVQLTLLNHGFNTDRLKLELTESVVLNNIGDTVTKMHALRQAGVRFSMDDFGTGYSSLSYLTQLPLDQIKIDQSFVRNIGQKHNDSVMVQTIIGMAHNLGMEVIAEGVETEEQRTFLEQHGCAFCQGYLFGKPVPVEEFEAELRVLQ